MRSISTSRTCGREGSGREGGIRERSGREHMDGLGGTEGGREGEGWRDGGSG